MIWIITAAEILCSVIAKDKLPIYDIPHVQIVSLMALLEDEILEYGRVLKSNVVDTTIEEIGVGVILCSVTSKEDL